MKLHGLGRRDIDYAIVLTPQQDAFADIHFIIIALCRIAGSLKPRRINSLSIEIRTPPSQILVEMEEIFLGYKIVGA